MIYTAIDRETIAVSNAVKQLTAAKITNQVTYALCQVLTNAMRITFEGTDPAGATTGHLYTAGDFFEVWGHNDLKNLKAIRDSADGSLEVTYFGRASA